MTHETVPTNHQAAEALLSAEEAIYSLVEQPAFAEACLQRGLDPNASVDTTPYWELVGDFALHDIAQRRAAGEPEVTLTAFELIALTPSFLHTEAALQHDQGSSREDMHDHKARASYFNGLLRYFGSNFDARASELSQAMANVADIAGLSGPDTDDEIRSVVRGAQHELAFGQILAHTGHGYQPADTEQDLKGADYTIELDGDRLLVDVKASLSEIEALGGEKSAFAIRWPRNRHQEAVIVMYSLTQDADFHDSLAIPDQLAAERAPVLTNLLAQAKALRDAA